MTAAEFIEACAERLIDVDIALEDNQVLEALVKGDDDEVTQRLDSNF